MDGHTRYVPNVGKALEVILWLASRRPGIDIYHVVKAAFYADKDHINKYGRPIVGDDYRAATFGPLPQVIYGLLRRQPIELIALGNNGPLPFRVDESYRVYAERNANERKLSVSDIAALGNGLAMVDGKSFDELFEMSHEEYAYLNAIAGVMEYRDFISLDAENRAQKVAFVEEAAPSAVF